MEVQAFPETKDQGFTSVANPSYEQKRGVFVEWLRIGLIRILGLLPPKPAQTVFLFLNRKNDDPVTVFKHVTTWRALETMYTYSSRRASGKVSLLSVFWQNLLDNARSIRNRLGMVKKELNQIILEMATNDQECVHILSIGSGSARSVLETIALFNGGSPKIKALFIDADQSAIEFSKQLAHELGINGCATRLTGNFFRLERDAAEFNPEIVELVGLLDYLTDRQVVVLLGKAYRILTPGGYLVTGNITPNAEKPFVTKGINWPMIYRSPEELKTLLVEAGFPPETIRVEQEPLQIHTIAIAQKLPSP